MFSYDTGLWTMVSWYTTCFTYKTQLTNDNYLLLHFPSRHLINLWGWKKPIGLLKIYHKWYDPQLGWQQSYAVNVKNHGMTYGQSLL